jgi:hypothetical protein
MFLFFFIQKLEFIFIQKYVFFEEAKRNYIKTTAQAQAVPENIVQ